MDPRLISIPRKEIKNGLPLFQPFISRGMAGRLGEVAGVGAPAAVSTLASAPEFLTIWVFLNLRQPQ